MQKWGVIRIYCDFLERPHDKYCICICPQNGWFMFINSDPPIFRKARELAVVLNAQDATFLQHTSYVDVTKLQEIEVELARDAMRDGARDCGVLAPFVIERIIVGVQEQGVMPDAHRLAVLND